MTARVLVLDDDATLRAAIRVALAQEGFDVVENAGAGEAEAELAAQSVDLLVMGVQLPGVSGIDLCHRLRERPATARLPILMLLNSGRSELRIAALSAGADDCLVLPLSPIELVVRAKNILRRLNPSVLQHLMRVGDLTLDLQSRRVHRQKREVRLGPTEFRLLEFLMRSPGRVYSRSELKASLWGDDAAVDERAIDVQIGRLRKGISLGKPDTMIRTVRGTGYALGDY